MVPVPSTQDLHEWSDRLVARSEAPRLLRYLLHARGAELAYVDLPAGEGIQRPGWDGQVDCRSTDPWIPRGESVWEIGTGRNPHRKAEEDYRKRTSEPGDVDLRRTTFVFVTTRRWAEKKSWIREKARDGQWKEVRAYDAEDLEHWLEQCPSVSLLLSEILGRGRAGLQSLGMVWEQFAEAAEPPITPETVVARRDDSKEALIAWLKEGPGRVRLRAETELEALAFAAAAIQTEEPAFREAWLSQAVVVRDGSVALELKYAATPMLIALTGESSSVARQLAAAGHHVLVAVDRTALETTEEIRVPHPVTKSLAEVLEKSGLERARATRVALDSGRSLTVLRRLLSPDPDDAQPAWADPESGRNLLPALMAGAWDSQSPGDREILASLAQTEYPEFEESLIGYISRAESPLKRADSVWALTSHAETFRLLARFLTREHFDRVRDAATLILGTPDPSLDLPADKRWAATVYEKGPPYSSWLREGILDTVTLVGIQGDKLDLKLSVRASDWADGIVRELLRGADFERWASLNDVLPQIAESAPDALLEAVEADLADETPVLSKLLAEEEEPLFGRCRHAGLLWALETLAWQPLYLTRVVVALGRLADKDPGGRWANRPASSLTDILLLWMKHTAASIDQKLAAIERLMELEPDVAWNLVTSLLQTSHQVTSGTREPRWREWSAGVSKEVTVAEFREYEAGLARLAIAHLEEEESRYAGLLDALEDLDSDCRRAYLEQLEAYVRDTDRVDKLDLLRRQIRSTLHRHRSFPEADWALPAESLDQLEQVYSLLQPEDPILRHSWLFDDHFPQLPTGERKNWREAADRVEELRQAALEEIIRDRGHEGLNALVRAADTPGLVGVTAANYEDAAEVESFVLEAALNSSDPKLTRFAQAFISRMADIKGSRWIDEKTEQVRVHEPEAQAAFCLALPLDDSAFVRLKQLGAQVAEIFWSRVQPNHANTDESVVHSVVEHLLGAERPEAALELIVFADSDRLTFKHVADTLEGLADSCKEHGQPLPVDNWQVENAFERLDSRVDLGDPEVRERAASLEMIFLLPLKHTRRQPRILHDMMADDPKFFAEVVSLAYRPDTGAADYDEPKGNPARAQSAAELLDSWNRPPGTQGEELDGKALEQWFSGARAELRRRGWTKAGDYALGRVLAHTPAVDGTWPAEPARLLIEETASVELERGICEAIVFSSKPTWRHLAEGGQQERDQEAAYKRRAESLAAKWPRTAKVLNEIAEWYARKARFHDSDAERQDLRYN